jgi:acetylornithine/succinyldiaminopimelate/putrescine aminotransferase
MAAVDLAGVSAKRVVLDALEAGILLNATSDQTLRFLPPLTVTAEQVDRVGRFLEEQLGGGSENTGGLS